MGDVPSQTCDRCRQAVGSPAWRFPPGQALCGFRLLCDGCHGVARAALEALLAQARRLSIEAVLVLAERLDVGQRRETLSDPPAHL